MMAGQTPLVRCDKVSKQYRGAADGDPLMVLRQIDLTVAEGETVAIVGPSGSGKSTLLNLIAALDQPCSGTVRVAGQDLATLKPGQIAAYRNRQVGMVFQQHHLLPQCSALENVLVPVLAQRTRTTDDDQQRAASLLREVGLAERKMHRPAQLSGGECQRVAVVRALIQQPPLLLADEPTGSLDRAASKALADLLIRLSQSRGVAVIMVTHSQAMAERMGRTLLLRDGALVEQGATS